MPRARGQSAPVRQAVGGESVLRKENKEYTKVAEYDFSGCTAFISSLVISDIICYSALKRLPSTGAEIVRRSV